jgi:hypothetical protein
MKSYDKAPQGAKKEALRQLQVESQNNTMAMRMSQMMIKRLIDDNQAMGKDLAMALAQLSELQYKFSAVQQVLNLDATQLANIANDLRLKAFNEASDKADVSENLVSADVVSEESTVTIASETDDGPDTGIFRSRIKIAEAGVPALLKGFLGQPVGTKVDVELNGKVHHVELLAVRNPIATLVQPSADAPQDTQTLN